MKPNHALLVLLAANLTYAGFAQITVNPNTRVSSQRITVAEKDLKKIGTYKYIGIDYTVWKNGKHIPTYNMGGTDSIFQTFVNGSWSVGYSGYNLLPKKTMVSISVRVQNRKKYTVTVHYSTNSHLKMSAVTQYTSDKENDYQVSATTETQDFYPDKKWPGSFSFIIEPELVKLGSGAQLAVGYPTVALIMLSIPEIKIMETGKKENDYYLNYLGITIKEN